MNDCGDNAAAIAQDEPWRGWADALCGVAVREVDGVHGASLSLRTAGLHEQLAATGRWDEELDALHLTVGQGPALTALATSLPVLVPDLAAAHDRWPWYVTAAAGTGLAAVYAFPLRAHGVGLATLTLFRRCPGPLSASAAKDAGILADLCATVVAHDLDGKITSPPADRPGPQSGPYHDIAVASGIVAAQQHLSVADALTRLRAAAFGGNVPLALFASDVISGRVTID